MAYPRRFVDRGKFLDAFADQVMVRCVACDAPGVVEATWSAYRWQASFRCQHCQLVLASAAGDWLGPVRLEGRQPCGYCGHQWLRPTRTYPVRPDDVPEQLAAECPECAHQTWVKVCLTRTQPEDRCCDPHFGLPLRLAMATRHGTVWAYNLAHLEELTAYVSAKLRVRQGAANRSMFSRLPKWMKLAKHRDEIASALRKIRLLAQ